MKRVLGGALLAGAMLTGAARADTTQFPAVRQEELYLSAMRALAEGRPDEATELLMRFLEKEPQHAGAWLDLAISQCELGHAAEAERLFVQIELRFAPPPGIVEVIRDHRTRGCAATPSQRGLWALTLGHGYDSNVNQGASSPNFDTGAGDTLLHWQLSPDYLPKSDQYNSVSADFSRALGAKDTLGFVQLRARRHEQVHTQDTTSLLFGLERPWRVYQWRGRATAALGLVQLDGHYYQRQAQLQVRAIPPVTLPERVDWTLTAGLSHLTYPTRTKYDANTVELGSSLGYRDAASQSMASLGLLSDHGQTGRLGGSRDGWYTSLLTYRRLGPYVDGQLDWSRQVWRSSTAYSPGLIDVVRHQDTQQLHATLTVPLRLHHSLQLEWRAVRNRENISLFQYNSRTVQLSWRWDNN